MDIIYPFQSQIVNTKATIFQKKFFTPVFALPGPYYLEIDIFATRKQSLYDADLIFIFN